MKRLIALLAGLAVMGSMSMTSVAAFSDEIALNADGTTYTAALPSDAATANAGKQTTIVAYKGNSIEVGSIQYINQEAADSFTFQLMDELTEDVKVVMGGEAIDKQEVGTIFFEKETDTYTISGSVNNFVEADFYTMIVEEGYIDAADLDTYKAAYGTTAYLTTPDNAVAFLNNYGDELVIDAIASCEVSDVDGTYAFTDLTDGEYAIVIYRAGALPYAEYVTVAGADVDLGALDIVLGDLIGAKDFVIDPSDVTAVVEGATDITDPDSFIAANDVAHDGVIDPSDLSVVVQNAGDITVYGTELINAYFS